MHFREWRVLYFDIPLKFVSEGQTMVCLPIHIWVTQPQWVDDGKWIHNMSLKKGYVDVNIYIYISNTKKYTSEEEIIIVIAMKMSLG